MVQTLAISKKLTSMAAVQKRFNLVYATDDSYFTEWREELPGLTDPEQTTLSYLQKRFFEHRDRGSLPEGTVDKLIVSPLLDLAGLYDSRFTIRTEAQVEILLEERDELLQGRIDTLIFQEEFWVLVIEAKNTTLSLSVAIPQALTYMTAHPQGDLRVSQRDRPVFGLVTNGDEFRFIKLLQQTTYNSQFDLSDVFSLLPPQRSKLSQVLQILKRISRLMV
jgi:hypothetical protein